MIRIEYEWITNYANQEKFSRYDLGHITLFFSDEKFSSKEYGSRKMMMIFIAAVELLNGVVELNKKKKHFEFIGANSSYILNFKKINKNYLSIMELQKRR